MLNRKNILKGIGAFLVATLLFCSSLSVIANPIIDKSKQNIQTTLPVYSPPTVEGYETIIDENFTGGTMPPTDWEHIKNNSDDTWYIDDTDPHSEPYCGTCYHDSGLQDEWLITRTLNFKAGGYTEIYLRFWWYTSYYEAVHKDYHDLNVSISTDGGKNWTLIWNEDNVGKFYSWVWYDTNLGEPIDLSAYVDETDVKIGFQYYSAEGVDGRQYSIDDIVVYGNSTPFWCSIGGPYYYHFDYQPIEFHGDAYGGEKPYRWQWDFGDGDTANTPYIPIHFYDELGTYNVSLIVKDNGELIAFNQTKVHIYTGPPPDIQIYINKSGIGINAELKNVGNENISYIGWKIIVNWGPLKTFEKEVENGTIQSLAPKTSAYISSGYFFGFGRISILISAEPEGAPAPPERRFKAFKFGPFIFNAHEG
ncbi:MAG: PKD domain-containing protein [Petrotogales bacterium]